jgi:hypothetical protein
MDLNHSFCCEPADTAYFPPFGNTGKTYVAFTSFRFAQS